MRRLSTVLRTGLTLLIFCTTFSAAEAQQAKKPTTGRSVQGESKKVKYRDKTDLNFDAQSIEGQVKNPFASMLSARDPNFNSGFVQLRRNWHDQMVMSVSGLSQ